MFEISQNSGGTADEKKPLFTATADLCPRALKRLQHKIEMALKEPPQRVRRKAES